MTEQFTRKQSGQSLSTATRANPFPATRRREDRRPPRIELVRAVGRLPQPHSVQQRSRWRCSRSGTARGNGDDEVDRLRARCTSWTGTAPIDAATNPPRGLRQCCVSLGVREVDVLDGLGWGQLASRLASIRLPLLRAVAGIAWLRLLALPPTLKACEPKALRYRFLHVPARLTHSARRRHLRFPATCPGPPTSSPRSPPSAP